MKQTITVITLEDGEEVKNAMPAVWGICPVCRGDGKHALRFGHFTEEDWEQESEVFKRDYVAGVFDLRCERCAGTGKVLVPDYVLADTRIARVYEEGLREDAEDAATVRRENREILDY